VALAFLDDHGGLSAEVLVALLDCRRLVLQSRVEFAADVQQRNAGLGQRLEIVEQRLLGNVAAEDGVLGVDARYFVRVFGSYLLRSGPRQQATMNRMTRSMAVARSSLPLGPGRRVSGTRRCGSCTL